MDSTIVIHDEEDRKKGIIISLLIHVLLFLLCFLPFLKLEKPLQPISGILVVLGNPDAGSVNDIADTDEEAILDDISEPEEVSSKSQNDTKTSPIKDSKTEKSKNTKDTSDPLKAIEKESTVVAKKQTDQKTEKASDSAAEKNQKLAEEKARKESEKEAEEKAKQEQYNKSKSQFSDLLRKDKGTNGASGNQGDPKGDPNAEVLDKIATGSGQIGEGLSDRDVIYEPIIEDKSQKVGRIVISVCVNSAGKVTKAKYTQRGSTTTDKYLIDLAEKAAWKYQFSISEIETQCGNLTIDFKVI